MIARLPPDAKVLDLGCGGGLPVAQSLVEHGFDVTGVDLCPRQIELARQSAPRAKFFVADMTSAQFPAESFDAVVAFYSISHVPRAEQAGLVERIAFWLKPGGLFMASFGKADGEWVEEWLGTSMFFSHYNPDRTGALVLGAG
ncbi:MAG TPA: class I SAM-dependent methyltransferase, partial [Roseiarcus sp.]|nr:class I SAM-dependent methyltransferase [Roseiarcus sp.]